MHDFNGVGDLLRFSPLSPAGAPAPRAGSSPSASCAARYDELERRSRSRPGCAATAASRSCERIWKPLLDSRFDGDPYGPAGDLPLGAHAADVRRAQRKGGGGEEMGHIVGGHQRLIDAMVARAAELGVEARTDAPVERPGDADGRRASPGSSWTARRSSST